MKHLANTLLVTTFVIGIGHVGNTLANGNKDQHWDDRKGHPGLRFMVEENQAAIQTNSDNIADNFALIQGNRDDIAANSARIEVLESVSGGGGDPVPVDCDADADAFRGIEIQSNTTYVISGLCNGPIWIENRQNVSLQGDGTGIKDDGVVLPAGLAEQPYGAIGVWQSRGISLANLTVSAANYVGQDYAFGSNVASLSAGNQSYVDVTEVDFVGGDYSVDVYNGTQVNLRGGVTVTGYNRAGLSAFNHGMIRTFGDISVSGLVGTSTETYPYAISAISNSVVEVRDGGSFSGASGQAVDEYPTAVWSGDNSTVRFRNSTNPSTVNGSIESAYSSMVRISGNLVLNGALAAYHRGYIRATGLSQSDGPIYAGDASTIRLEQGNVTTDTIDIYRQGNLRTNNTVINKGGADPIWVGGLSLINLRGLTDLNGAEISCYGYGYISIRSSVLNVGIVNYC